MAYEPRTFQSTTANTPPTGTDPMVDNTANGDVQAIKLINPTAGSVAPWINQASRAQSLPVALSTEDAALLADLLTNTTFAARLPAALGAGGGLKIDGSGAALPVSGTFFQVTQPVSNALGATAANQATEITSLGNIDTKVPPLGQALAAASTPVVLTTIQQTALTPPAAITGFATETTLSAQSAKLPATLGQKAMAASLAVTMASDQSAVPVTPAATESHLGEVGSSATTVDATLTRPADTTAYAANDEMTDTGGAILTFTGAARISGGSGFITDVAVVDSSNVATKAQLVLFLYDTTSTPAADNAAFAPTDGVQNTLVAAIPINIWYPGDDTSGAGGNAVGVYSGPPISFKTSGSANLFGRVKVLNAYVPTSAEALKVRMKVRRD